MESSCLHKNEEALHKTFIKELQVSRKITKQIVEKGSDGRALHVHLRVHITRMEVDDWLNDHTTVKNAVGAE
ncbi:hypothetical protein F441_13863 [Phytophthora nicotianae CJ01A1]|uniref:Uncharacterized protein n=1 Tax=Phytophthora nicotianae CJ01A1 TaxID=1317063 RepID=W2WK42_PHYNI|nr:hypothetical protein F441_13863 [Phytophthora nicotianae CJ01A1]